MPEERSCSSKVLAIKRQVDGTHTGRGGRRARTAQRLLVKSKGGI